MSNSALSATLQRSDNWRKWRNYSALGLGIILTLAPLPASLIVYFLGITAFVFLALGIKRPAFIVAAIIMAELTVAQYPPRFAGLPMNIRYAITFGGAAITLFLAPLMSQRLALGPGWWRVLIPGVAFVILSGISTAQGFTPELTSQAVRYYGISLAVMLMIAALISDARDFRIVGIIAIMTLVLSATAATMQHFTLYGIPAPEILGTGLSHGRASGLTQSPIHSSSHFMIGMVLLWGIVTQLTLEKPVGRFIFLLTLLVTIGLYFTYTRSALGGAAVGILLMTPLLKGRVRKEIILVFLLLLPVAAFFMTKSNTRYTRDISEDKSSASRSVLWSTGLAIAEDYPILGIGYDAFNQVAPDYVSDIELSDEVLDTRVNAEAAASKNPVHNDFLRVWISFGLPSLIVYSLLLLGIAANSLQAYFRAKDPWLRGLSIGCFGALIAYITNSIAHNSLDSTLGLWILAGLSLALLKLNSQKENDFQNT